MISFASKLKLGTKIMEALVAGCALGDELYSEVSPYANSEAAFNDKLYKLINKELIRSQLYDNSGTESAHSLYALTGNGARYLAENWKYKIDEIRTVLPALNMAAHELAVTAVVRSIRWEMLRVPYEVFYYDDPACKQNKRHLDLRGWIPDLLLLITRIKNLYYPDPLRMAVEIDMGSRKLADVLRTVLNRDDMTLFVCATSERIDAIKRELSKYEELHELVYFALLNDFCSRPGGVFMTDWTNLGGSRVSLYPE